mmetsp:Transcript_32395/g.82263  ORF Transcript_32395/g.82263 Transcript_32395/m.82263 type:complete len:241 (-) Transcript_32395:508-1230(-)
MRDTECHTPGTTTWRAPARCALSRGTTASPRTPWPCPHTSRYESYAYSAGVRCRPSTLTGLPSAPSSRRPSTVSPHTVTYATPASLNTAPGNVVCTQPCAPPVMSRLPSGGLWGVPNVTIAPTAGLGTFPTSSCASCLTPFPPALDSGWGSVSSSGGSEGSAAVTLSVPLPPSLSEGSSRPMPATLARAVAGGCTWYCGSDRKARPSQPPALWHTRSTLSAPVSASARCTVALTRSRYHA